MANIAGPPIQAPPPPPPGFLLPPPPGRAGGAGQQNPQSQTHGQFIPIPIRQRLQKSSRIQDITPQEVMEEAACLEKLTSHAAFTIRKVPERDAKEKHTWARAEIVDEKWAQEDIVKQIEKLNKNKRTVADKKSALARYQQGQITSLLDDLGTKEPEPAFQWSLMQLDRTEKPASRARGTSKKPLYETIIMTVYVKRAPHKDINPIQLYHDLEKIKAERMRSLTLPQQSKPQPHHTGQGGGDARGKEDGYQQPQGSGPPLPPPAPFKNFSNKDGPPIGQAHAKSHGQGHGQGHGARSGNKPKAPKQDEMCGKNRGLKNYRDHRGSGTSDSDLFYSDTGSSSDESSLGTSVSSRSRQCQQRKHNKDATPSHNRRREPRAKDYPEAQSLSPRRHRMSDAFGGVLHIQQRSYAPEFPCAIPAFDPITSAYQTGKEDAMAERYGVKNRLVQQQKQMIQPISERFIEPFVETRPVVSYVRLEPQYSKRPQPIQSRYSEDRYFDDVRSVENDLIVDRQRRAADYMERRSRDIYRRLPDPRSECFEQRPGDSAQRTVERPEFLERGLSEVGLEYYERRAVETDKNASIVGRQW